MDWNWFFSTLAQSSAAIAGFLGAFLIGAILNRENEYNSIGQDADNLLSGVKRQMSTFSILGIQSYNMKKREHVRKTYDYYNLVLKESAKLDPMQIDALITQLEYSPYEDRKSVADDIRKYLGTMQNQQYIGSINITEEFIENLNEKRRRIDEEMIRTIAAADSVRSLLSRAAAFPKGRRAINFTLTMNTGIFLLCIVFPILMLPSASGINQLTWQSVMQYLMGLTVDPKSAILLVFSAVFLAVQTYFLMRNNRSTQETGVLETLTKYRDIRAYSEFLSNYSKNVALNAKSVQARSAI